MTADVCGFIAASGKLSRGNSGKPVIVHEFRPKFTSRAGRRFEVCSANAPAVSGGARRSEPRRTRLRRGERTVGADAASRFDPHRVPGVDHAAIGSSSVGSVVRRRRRRNSHPSELAQLRGHPSATGSTRSIRDCVHRCARQHAAVVPDKRPERVRRKRHGSGDEKRRVERRSIDPERDHAGQRRRARFCVHDRAKRNDQPAVTCASFTNRATVNQRPLTGLLRRVAFLFRRVDGLARRAASLSGRS